MRRGVVRVTSQALWIDHAVLVRGATPIGAMRHHVPGDLSQDEIERRYRLALADIRRGGTGECARRHRPRKTTMPLRTARVLQAITAGETTVHDLAVRLGYDTPNVWGHVCFLRRQHKIEVKRWTWSANRRRVAIYGVITHE
jgi:hypothetical protein